MFKNMADAEVMVLEEKLSGIFQLAYQKKVLIYAE